MARGAGGQLFFISSLIPATFAASSHFFTESACFPSSWSFCASAIIFSTSAFFLASEIFAVPSLSCLIRSGHWLASTTVATNATATIIAPTAITFFMSCHLPPRRGGADRLYPGVLRDGAGREPAVRPRRPRPPPQRGSDHRSVARPSG